MRAVVFKWVMVAGLVLSSASVWAESPDFNHYDVYMGDMNGDGLDDIYFHPAQQFILIHGEVAIPITFTPERAFVSYGEPDYTETYNTDCDFEINEFGWCDVSRPLSVLHKEFSQVEPIDQASLDGLDFTVLERNVSYYVGDLNGDGVQDIAILSDRFANDPAPPEYDPNDEIFFGQGAIREGLTVVLGTTLDEDYDGIQEVQFDLPTGTLFYDYNGNGQDDFVLLGNELYADRYYSLGSEGLEYSANTTSHALRAPTLHGASAGNFRVDEGGAATYNIPITVPAGTAGVAPQLALNYSSQGGNGLLGLGWSLSGGSSITRCQQTLVQDGQAKPITWTDEDKLCLNGQRLVQVGASGNETYYKPETDNFLYITQYTSETDIYFTVEAKDGSVKYYGNTVDSKQNNADGKTFTWALSESEDSVRNSILYKYQQNQGSDFRLAKIEYAFGGSDNTTPHAEIEFNYGSRIDGMSHYVAGHKFSTTLRLENIVVRNKAPDSDFPDFQEIRSYYLGYRRRAESDWVKKSVVEAIQECVSGQCLPATEFDWTVHGGLRRFSGGSTSINLMDRDSSILQVIPLDFNGDGFLDLAWLENDKHHDARNHRIRYALYNPVTFTYSPMSFTNGSLFYEYDESAFKSWESVSLQPMDYNGDGRQDLVAFRDKLDDLEIFLSVPNNNSWALSHERIVIDLDDPNRIMLDLNSDGLTDILTNSNKVLYLEENPNSSEENKPYHYVEQSISWQGFDQSFVSNYSDAQYFEHFTKVFVQAGDYDGDGGADLLIADRRMVSQPRMLSHPNSIHDWRYQEENYYIAKFENNTVTAVQFLGKRIKNDDFKKWGEGLAGQNGPKTLIPPVVKTWFHDVNGDSYSDVLIGRKENNDQVAYDFYLNDGKKLTIHQKDVFIPSEPDEVTLQLMDVNNDGYADIIYRHIDSGSVYYRFWDEDLEEFDGGRNGNNVPRGASIHMLYDANGDGQTDFIRSDGRHLKVSLNAESGHTGLITRFTNGLGAETNITYESLAITAHYRDQEALATSSGSFDSGAFYSALNSPFQHENESLADAVSSPVFEYKAGLPLAVKVTASSPRGTAVPGQVDPSAMSTLKYYYEGARFQAAGRGVLGFAKLQTLDVQTGILTETNYRQDWPYVGLPKSTVSYTPGGQKISENISTYGIVGWQPGWVNALAQSQVGTSVLPPLAVVKKASTDISYEVNSSHESPKTLTAEGTEVQRQTQTWEHDSYGNVIRLNTETQGAGLTLSKVMYNDYDSDASYGSRNAGPSLTLAHGKTRSYAELGRLTDTKSETTRNGSTTTRESRFSYYVSGNQAGLLHTEIIEPLRDDGSIKTYHYDSFGNISRTEVAAKNRKFGVNGALLSQQIQTRITELTYDTVGRHVNVEAVNDGKERRVTQEVLKRSIYGSPIKTKNGLNELVSDVEYDVLGRTIRASDNTGAWAATSYHKCDPASCPTGAVYYAENTVSGGGESRTYFDALARTVRKESVTFNGGRSCVDTEFDALGRNLRTSEPFICSGGANTAYWTEFTYDKLGRVVQSIAPNENGPAEQKYSYRAYATEVINPKLQKRKEVKNGLGELIEVTDELGGRIEYLYDSLGNLEYMRSHRASGETTSTIPEIIITHIEYDDYNRKIKMADPDKGVWEYKYNDFGEMVWQRDGNGQVTTNEYDVLARQLRQTHYKANGNSEYHTRWYYGIERDNGDIVEHAGLAPTAIVMTETPNEETCASATSIQCSYPHYDPYGRAHGSSISNRVNGQIETYSSYTEYNSYGQVFRQYDALNALLSSSSPLDQRNSDNSILSGTENTYNAFGYLASVKDLQRDKTIYQILETNARHQITRMWKGNGVTSRVDYYEKSGQIKKQVGDIASLYDVQYIEYEWDVIGNLKSRFNDSIASVNGQQRDLKESFCYDGLNRLIQSSIASENASFSCASLSESEQDVRYDSRGNILYKENVGQYTYDTALAGPHAVTSIGNTTYQYDANGNMVRERENGANARVLTYASFNKPTEIIKYNAGLRQHTTQFNYGLGQSRFLRKDIDKNNNVLTTQYIGNIEKITDQSKPNEILWRRYLGKSAIITITTDNNLTIDSNKRTERYVYNDHLGSLDVITNEVGTVVQSLSFNPWGERRDTVTWQEFDRINYLELSFNTDLRKETTRGFTGHEMADEVGIIHMNGRIYDPRIARFLQADPIIQAATHTQSLNRYAYTWNNPLNATDPTGYEVHWNEVRGAVKQIAAVVVAIVGAIVCGNICSGPIITALVGAATGALSAAIMGAEGKGILRGAVSGAIGSMIGAQFAKAELGAKVVMSGVSGGITSVISGGKFGHGFLSGMIGAFTGNLTKNWKSDWKINLANSISGGTTSQLTGGKFANGAVTGAFQNALSEGVQKIASRSGGVDNYNPYAGMDPEEFEFASGYGHELVSDTENPTEASVRNAIAQKEPLAKGKWRALTTDEIELAKSVFGDSIDYSDVRIYNKKFFPFQPKNVAMAPNGNIYFHPKGGLYSDNFADTNLKGLFIHEMTHVWQHQQGVNVAMRAMFNRTYEYTLTPGKPLTSYGVEQQGDFVRDYYRLQHDSAGGPLIELYKQAIPFAQ